jgi:serine/threonine protein phosphatase PrpC
MSDHSDEVSRREVFSAALKGAEFQPPSASVRVEFGARSHRGHAHQENEDHYVVLRFGRHLETLLTSLSMSDLAKRFDESAYAAVVADGIGGGGVGAVAARLAVTTLVDLGLQFGKWNMRIDPETIAEMIDRSHFFYRRTHDTVLKQRLGHAELTRMATTLTSMVSVGADLFVTHVGHSRCYLFRNGVLSQLTGDQTLREHFATSQRPASVGQAMDDLQHILTDVIGARSAPGVTVEHFALVDDDCVLLCTNGLTDMVDDDAIAEVLASRRNAHEQCDLLVDMALAHGGTDNTTVVLAHYDIPPS